MNIVSLNDKDIAPPDIVEDLDIGLPVWEGLKLNLPQAAPEEVSYLLGKGWVRSSRKKNIRFSHNFGVEGFEPPIHGTKNRCLTAWLHPIRFEEESYSWKELLARLGLGNYEDSPYHRRACTDR